ncbi:MAG: PAS domain S-box protein [Methanoregula sp.]|nr:PAS domain S-box protein [Methanoregula sp.]
MKKRPATKKSTEKTYTSTPCDNGYKDKPGESLRQRAEAQLRYQTAVMANVNDAIIASDEHYKITLWNAAAESLYGWKADEVLGRFGLDITQTEFPDMEKSVALHTIEERGQWRGETTQVRKDGTRISVEISSVVLHDESGRITGYISVNRDITERKRAEKALKESESCLSLALDVGNAGIWEWNLERNDVCLNDQFHVMLGYTPGELPTTMPEWLSYHHPEDIPVWRSKAEAYLRGDTAIYESKHRIRAKSGSWAWVFTRGQIVSRTATGTPKLIMGIAMNVTKRCEAEAAACETEQRFQAVFDAARDGMLVADPETHRFILANASILMQTGYTETELLSLSLSDIHPQADLPYVIEQFEKQNHGEITLSSDVPVLCKDGTIFFADINSSTVTLQGRQYLLGIFRDMTERKQMEKKLRENEKRLIKAQEISHTGSWEYNLRTGKIWGSAEGARIYGLPAVAGDFPIEKIEACIPERERVHQALVDLIHEGKEYNLEFAINPADGSDQKVIISIAELEKDARGNAIRVVGVIHDITERKKAEDEITFKNIILSTQQETSPDGILIVDEQGKMISFNQRFVELWGIPEDVVASRSDERALQSVLGKLENPDEFLTRVRYLYEHREEKSREEILLIDGKVFDRYSAPMFGKTGKYFGRVWYFRDITDKKRAEEEILKLNRDLERRVEERTSELRQANEEIIGSKEELRLQLVLLIDRDKQLAESEERYRTVADFTYDWESWIAPDGTFLYVSPSCERITGYRPEEFIRDPDLLDAMAHTTDDRDKMIDHHSLVKDCCREPTYLEFQIVTKNGEIRWIGHRCQPVYNPRGEYLGLRCSNRDITGRKQADKVLRETLEYLNNLFNYANAPIIVWDTEFRITRFNHAFEHLTGRIERDVLGQPLEILFPADSRDASLTLIKNTLEGEHWKTVEIPILSKDGSIQTALWNSANVLDEDGKIISTIAQGVDITERKKMSRLIEASLTEKEALLKEVHHRVKNNLQIIASVLNLQIRKIDDPSTIEALKDCQSRVRSMSLVHEHLYRGKDLSHIDLGNYLRALGTVLFNSYDARDHGVRFELDIHDIYVDTNTAIPLGLISNELITNSLKYAFKEKEGGKLSITATEDPTTLIFVVADNGAGMAPDITLENQTSLGLQLVSSLTDQLNGTVTIDRSGGTKFVFTFPRTAENKGKAGP